MDYRAAIALAVIVGLLLFIISGFWNRKKGK
jgi:uncharacterized protein YneF (UPF0154 family)